MLPLSPPQGAQKRKTAVFHTKMAICLKKVCYKVCAKTVSDKVVRHSLAYPSVRKWLVGTSPSTWKFGVYWPNPLQNSDFQSIFARSTSAVTPSKKFESRWTRRSQEHLLVNDFLPRYPSAYRKKTLDRNSLVWHANDSGYSTSHSSLHCLLDLSAAFDYVNQDLLLERLQLRFGLTVTGVVL